MSLANDSILVTPGSGATVATHSAGSKEHQVVMLAGADGQIVGSRPLYFVNIAPQVHVASANTVHWDLFNADASLLVRVLTIRQIPDIVTAVTGVAFAWKLARTTSVGTGGTTQTPWLPDTTQTAVDADITCRSKPTGGAAEGTILRNYNLHGEETNTGTMIVAALGGLELVPPGLGENGILLRQNEGLRCVQITSNANGNTGWLIGFSIE
jgi:hypothetical protein